MPVWDYSNDERMLAVTGFTPLLVNLESMTSKPNAGEVSNNCIAWKFEKAVHYFVCCGGKGGLSIKSLT